MIRGAFLRYYFQLKIGRMRGAIVAYHNTEENFGFEYIKIEEMEKRIFTNGIYADLCFMICSKTLTFAVDKILEDLKNQVKFLFLILNKSYLFIPFLMFYK